MTKKHDFHKLHPLSLGISVGLIWGVGLLIATYASANMGYLAEFFALLTGMYPGYTVSQSGMIAGLVFGFIDGFVGGYVFGWLYNKCLDKFA